MADITDRPFNGKAAFRHTGPILFFCIVLASLQSCAMLNDEFARKRYIGETRFSVLPAHRERTLEYGTDPAQQVRLFEPENGATKAVWIYLVHGGGWRESPTQDLAWATAALLNEGYIVALPSYRLVPQARGRELVDDVDRGLLLTAKTLRAEGRDGPVVLGGISAGAQLAAMVCWKANDPANTNEYPRIAALALFSGVLDFSVCRNPVITRLLVPYAGKPGASGRTALDPYTTMSSGLSFPVLCMYSPIDGTVEPENSLRFSARWKVLNPASDYHLESYPGLSHDEVYWNAFTGNTAEFDALLRFITGL